MLRLPPAVVKGCFRATTRSVSESWSTSPQAYSFSSGSVGPSEDATLSRTEVSLTKVTQSSAPAGAAINQVAATRESPMSLQPHE
jgi:hypothetical protein